MTILAIGNDIFLLGIGGSVDVAQGELLTWLAGRKVSIQFPIGTAKEEMGEVLYWLLSGG